MYVRMYVYTYKCTDILYPIYHKYWTLLIIFIIPDIARSSEYLGGLGEGVVPQVVLSDLDMSQSEVPLSPAKTHVVWAPDIQENTLFIGFHGKTMIVYDKYRIWKKKLCWYWIFVGKREKKEHRWQTWVFAGNTIIINSTSLYNDRPSDFAVPSHLDPFGNSYCGLMQCKAPWEIYLAHGFSITPLLQVVCVRKAFWHRIRWIFFSPRFTGHKRQRVPARFQMISVNACKCGTYMIEIYQNKRLCKGQRRQIATPKLRQISLESKPTIVILVASGHLIIFWGYLICIYIYIHTVYVYIYETIWISVYARTIETHHAMAARNLRLNGMSWPGRCRDSLVNWHSYCKSPCLVGKPWNGMELKWTKWAIGHSP